MPRLPGPVRLVAIVLAALTGTCPCAAEPKTASFRGEVLDAGTGKPVAARIYIQGADGKWHHVRSADPAGSSVNYDKQRPESKSVEIHTTVSAHPFVADLAPGKYTVTIERGKEYHPLTQQVTPGPDGASLQFKLTRWVDMPARGWYSGDTHTHRSLEELPNVMQAEDLNVAFPLLHWVRDAFTSPKKNPGKEVDPGRLIALDGTHVIWPRNTEYEIFSVNKKPHTLGAFFVLNHQSVFDEGVPPVSAVAFKARREGGLIELDKHNWPWSMALVPIMPVDLYELTNNHIWRTEFAFRGYGEPAAEYMKVERNEKGWTEWGWLSFGFQNYYALLDCGFRLRPTAGTASGVHPVPLGFGRVYVELPNGFSYDAWLKGLNAGRSFVTTGPMLFAKLNAQPAGSTIKGDGVKEFKLTGSALSARPLNRIEIIVNGEIATTLKPENRKTREHAFESSIDERLRIDGSSWVAVRCFEERPDKREQYFAHTSPFFIDFADQPLRPRKEEVEYLNARVEQQLKRSADVLPAAALDEYREALRKYQEIAKGAR